MAAFLPAASGTAQGGKPAPKPYATLDRDTVDYRGPGRDPAHDLAGLEIKIGLVVPLQGPRQAEGEALVQAARLAIEDEAAHPLPGGRRLVLVPRDESSPWGTASNRIVELVLEDQALTVITSTSGITAHLRVNLIPELRLFAYLPGSPPSSRMRLRRSSFNGWRNWASSPDGLILSPCGFGSRTTA